MRKEKAEEHSATALFANPERRLGQGGSRRGVFRLIDT